MLTYLFCCTLVEVCVNINGRIAREVLPVTQCQPSSMREGDKQNVREMFLVAASRQRKVEREADLEGLANDLAGVDVEGDLGALRLCGLDFDDLRAGVGEVNVDVRHCDEVSELIEK